MSGGIFISYRRGDSSGFAGRIYDRVASRLNRERVFFDVDNIELGADFVRVLSERVADCDALVAIIGKDWLSSTDEENRRRLDDPDDFVRIEIETALQRDIPVIPVLVDGAVMPRKENLPDPLKPLSRRQGLGISHERFDTDSERLTKALAFVEEARRKREEAAAELDERQRREAAKRADEDRRKAEAEATQRAEDERHRRDDAQAPKQIEEERQREVAQGALHVEEETRRVVKAERPQFVDLPRPRSQSAKWRLIAAVVGIAVIAAAAFFIAGHRARQSPVLIGSSETGASSRADKSETAAAMPPKSNLSQAPASSVQQNPVLVGDSKTAASIRANVSETAAAAVSPKPNLTVPPINVDDDRLVRECDRLAASPLDTNRPAGVSGVSVGALDVPAAISACRAASAQFPDAPRVRFELGRAFEANGSYDEAFAAYKTAADQGYAGAEVNLGAFYAEGRGVKQDYAQAMAWYQRAGNQGLAPAWTNIGQLYQSGHGVKQDYAQAIAWYQKAADQGNASAQGSIGWLYDTGNGVAQDYAKAMTWYRKAADQGNAAAQGNIGRLYLVGHGVKQDYAQAMAWYQKAADQGNASAQVSIGWLYDTGNGVAQDYPKAMAWYRKAADQGNAQAQYNIGVLYENGQGVTKDISEARAWYQRAADQGDQGAKDALKRLTK